MKDYIKEEINYFYKNSIVWQFAFNIGIDILVGKYPFFMVIFDIINLITNIIILFISKLLRI